MSTTPTFALPTSFLGLQRAASAAERLVVGVPFDLGTSNRAGARFGPTAIRLASRMLFDGHHPTNWVDPQALAIADGGDFAIALGDLAASLRLIEQQARAIAHPIVLGGDHSITLPILRALAARHGPLGLLHFDAHVDTWPDSFGQRYGHGSPFYHAIEEGLITPNRTVQIGIRSPVQRDVFEWTVSRGVTILDAMTVHEHGAAAAAERARAVLGGGPAYLSFDVDALDPAFAPGTGTPEIGGLASWQAQAILRRMDGIAFVGMDVVEVCPPYDVAEITALAAATIVWEYLALGAGAA
jgi:agmatinase